MEVKPVEALKVDDFYIFAIAALLPLTACMLVFQANPYHALVIRGILGAVAALVYALFGAADVALTEALVGTMLSITLYAVAVRSSLSMRLGILDQDTPKFVSPSDPLLQLLRTTLSKYYLRLELVPYSNLQALKTALVEKEVHTIVLPSDDGSAYGLPPERRETSANLTQPPSEQPSYFIQTRIPRFYDMIQTELPQGEIHPYQLSLIGQEDNL